MKLSFKRLTLDVPVGLLLAMQRRMKYVRAAGGVITDDDGLRLIMVRNGRADLPKGKMEQGETLREAALREVLEETGLRCTCAKVPMIKTYHFYYLFGAWHLKQTTWFDMHVEGKSPKATPQAEEGITAANWVDTTAWHDGLRHSYGTMRLISKRWQRLNR